MAKVAPQTKASLSSSVPKPKMQGGHGTSPTQQAKIQKKSGPASTGSSTVLYSKQPSGLKGTNPGAK